MKDCCDYSGSASKPANDTAISFDKPAELQLIGGSIGSNVVVGNGSTIVEVGVRWQSGGHIAQAAGTAGAKVLGLQQQPAPPLHVHAAAVEDASDGAFSATAPAHDDDTLRAEVAQLRSEVEALRLMVSEQR